MRRSRDRVVNKKRRSGNKNRTRGLEQSSKPFPRTPVKEVEPARAQSPEVKRLLAGIGTPPRTEPFTPGPFQLEALAAVEVEDVLVTAPPGSGTTWLAVAEVVRFREAG